MYHLLGGSAVFRPAQNCRCCLATASRDSPGRTVRARLWLNDLTETATRPAAGRGQAIRSIQKMDGSEFRSATCFRSLPVKASGASIRARTDGVVGERVVVLGRASLEFRMPGPDFRNMKPSGIVSASGRTHDQQQQGAAGNTPPETRRHATDAQRIGDRAQTMPQRRNAVTFRGQNPFRHESSILCGAAVASWFCLRRAGEYIRGRNMPTGRFQAGRFQAGGSDSEPDGLREERPVAGCPVAYCLPAAPAGDRYSTALGDPWQPRK